MKTVNRIIFIILFLIPFLTQAGVKEGSITPDDRDRLIRMEQKIETLRAEMTARFESVDKQFKSVDRQFDSVDKQFVGLRSEINARFDQLFNFMWAFIGIFTAMVVSIFGFAFWDRKLSLAPLKNENQKTLNALRDFAEHQPKLREILKNAGLL
jgi:hypothetical protein